MKKQTNIDMARYLAGEMDPGEEILFIKGIQQTDQKEELELMEKSWKHFNDFLPREDHGPDQAWNKLFDRLAGDGLIGETDHKARTISLRTLRIAATILVVIALGIPALYLGIIRDHGASNQSVVEAENGISTVDLPDGSRVYLNKGGRISYPDEFSGGRNVNLEGEAYFEVMSDPADPFIVRSGNVVISVLGTTFNVKGSEGNTGVEVYVESGKVQVSVEESGAFLMLEPGELCVAADGNLSSHQQSDANYMSWRTKDFTFMNEDLGQVLLELENAYHVSINAGDSLVRDLRITSTYRAQSIDAILQTIGTAFGFNVHKKGNEYFLTTD